ncbi:hypothetical protein [Streptomyces sp. NPDC001843]|uniref:hypothetical protein n=1 Tax=Streptomyces sp. NPDC001843 TaxID=3364617 RepID=UPI0036B8F122
MPLAVAVISEKLGTYASQDTTKIADEALVRGHTVHEVDPADVSQVEGRLIAKARRYTGADAAGRQEHLRIDLADMDVIHFRPNPPVDMSYLTTLYLLDRIKDEVLVINDPESIIRFPEKIFPLEFPEFTPPTLISRDVDEIRDFADRHHDVVIKPLYEYGGRGIARVTSAAFDEELVRARLAAGSPPLVSQAFLPRITAGDKRIFFIGGDVAGAFVRIPKRGSYIANIAQGGSIHPTTLTPREEELARLLGPKLVERGIYICGIDVIDDHVTEINITSSVGFSQIEELYGDKPQTALWDLIEKTA